MKPSNALILLGQTIAHFAIEQEGRWTWSEVVIDASATIETTAKQLVDVLNTADFYSGGLVLGVPAARCLPATFGASDLPDRDYTTRLFRFEEHLPLSAEQVVAEFIDATPTHHVAHTLGIAVERDWLERYVNAFELAGLAVDAIIPTTLLAARSQLPSSSSALLISEPGEARWQLLVCDDGVPQQWLQLPDDIDALKQAIRVLSLQGIEIDSLRCVSVTLQNDRSGLPEGMSKLERFESLAEETAADLLQGKTALINFRNHGLPAPDRLRLNRRAIDAMLVGVAAMLILLTLSFWIGAARYNAVSDHDQQMMMTRFHETLPGWPTPSNFRAVVASERRRLSPGVDGAAVAPTALAMMLRVLPPLPQNSDVSLSELTFAPEHFDLAGTLDRYESSQPLSDAIRAGGLNVSPVQAHRVSDHSWEFTLSGQARSPNPAGRP